MSEMKPFPIEAFDSDEPIEKKILRFRIVWAVGKWCDSEEIDEIAGIAYRAYLRKEKK